MAITARSGSYPVSSDAMGMWSPEFRMYGSDGEEIGVITMPDIQFPYAECEWYESQAIRLFHQTGKWPNFTEFKPEEYDFANDPRVVAVRTDDKIGRGTCSIVDECLTDKELCMEFDKHGLFDPAKALADRLEIERVLRSFGDEIRAESF